MKDETEPRTSRGAQLAGILRESEKICVFTGAGISCPSGIPDFRSAEGLYHQKEKTEFPPEQVLSHDFFVSRPDFFFRFYREKMLYPDAQPNAAHRFFADLEKQGKDVSVVTQNIDGLHQLAGSTKVYELHGSAHRNYCMKCGKRFGMDYILASRGVPRCDADGGIVRPEVVLYGEALPEDVIYQAVDAIRQADALLVVGTSLVVYPAASFVRYFRGKHLVLINRSATSYDGCAGLVINDDIVQVVRETEPYLQPER